MEKDSTKDSIKDSSKDNFIEIRDDTVDVQKIMEEIRNKIKERGIQEVEFPDTLSLADEIGDMPDDTTPDDDLFCINTAWNITAERPVTSHRKFIGPVLVFGKKVVRKLLRWYIDPFVDQQRTFNAAMVRVMNSTRELVDEKNDRIRELEQKVKEQEKVLQGDYKDALYRAEQNIRALNDFTDTYKDIQIMQSEKLKRIERMIHESGGKAPAVTASAGQPALPAGRETGQEAANAGAEPPAAGTGAKEPDESIDYFMFELKYRGSRAKIKESQKKYLKYFEGKNRILDIGCGRGEFLELLQEQGKTGVRGIDPNRDMVAYCRSMHLPVESADAVSYLNSIRSGDLEGIYMGQVAEHLRYPYMIRLIRLAYEKLAEGGVFIAETPNPMCLSIFSNAFYMDVSHEKPVHPLTLEFLLESIGFSSVEKIFFSEIKDKIPALQGSGIQNAEEFNAAMGRVNDLLFGMQDYAVIARK